MDAAPRLDVRLIEVLRTQLPEVATHTIDAVRDEVPAYTRDFGGPLAANIENAVQMALAGFLRLAGRGATSDPGTPLTPALDGAYALGRGEARSGRSADALLAAYRVGARVAWRELSAIAVESGVEADVVASFAELVFAYIDELSAASVAGHADELETTGRVLHQRLDQLGQALLRGDKPEALDQSADRADWKPPRTLTAVLLPQAQVRQVLGLVDSRTLHPSEAPGLPDGLAALLVAELGGPSRTRLLEILNGRHAVAGPERPWQDVRTSYLRAVRALELSSTGLEAIDTEARLVDLVVSADADALADLRRRALAPLDDLRPSTREKLTETLRAWLLHHGRREEIAAVLFVHPQTVRYRMGQLREAYGDALDDPDTVLALTVALAV
ncbi:PucR family transcriptional regulator [Nocardioides sp. InS609-2]|uniref:PucR family transcriptional regulator n=1 Tax=Nocardioides sp. InS609-2 TaxID=2760705 RepID=UPI0020BD6FB3|nr:PucR family transcriptional regulator [Nocardioides sp. InS609-2]